MTLFLFALGSAARLTKKDKRLDLKDQYDKLYTLDFIKIGNIKQWDYILVYLQGLIYFHV